MVLRELQRLLGRIYDIRIEHDIYEFLVTDRRQLTHAAQRASRNTEEELLVSEVGGDVCLSLFLDRAVLERLQQADPLEELNVENLADYWTALEGVSHFQYLAWNAGHDRPVAIHELEIQAEVDKYATALFLLGEQRAGRFPLRLHHCLFERAHVDHALAPPKAALYASASRYAAKFCQGLERRFLKRGRVRCEALIRELRHFYRLTHGSKIRHIEAAPAG
ncbi:MAG TPA: hypothetical protein VKB41_04205 [Steroidobacteraceae bacterium]|nr:hypothetical protein [Steroidobacteraceae bacterium]